MAVARSSSPAPLFTRAASLLLSPRLRSTRTVLSLFGALFLAVLAWAIGKSFYFVTVLHDATSAFHAAAVWGALVLASYAGWGTALNAWVFPGKRADWGLRCAWGWGVAIAIGGTLCAFGLARRRALEIFIAVGLVLLVVDLTRANARWTRRSLEYWARRTWRDAAYWLGVSAIFVLGLTLYLQSIIDHNYNANDDGIAYFGFAREVLEGGTLSQPFSLRRISVYGGKSLLDAIQMAIDVPYGYLNVIDKGMAPLTVLALGAGHARSANRGARAIVLLALLFVVSLPDLRINTAAQMTGTVFFLGLYRTMTWPPIKVANGWRPALPIALLAAGACTLRQSYLAPVGIFLIVAYGAEILRGVRCRRVVDRAALVDAGATAGLLILFLAPWWAMSQRWVGSFLFPIVKGHYNSEYGFLEPLKPFEWFHYVWANVCYCNPVKAAPLFLAAALSMHERGRRKPLLALVSAALVGFAMLVVSYPDSDPPNMGRYYFGFTFGAILAICLRAADLAARRRFHDPDEIARGFVAISLVLTGIGLQLYEDRDRVFHAYDGFLNQLQSAYEAPAPWERSAQNPVYKTVQDAVPAHEPIAVMVDSSSDLDYARNRIEMLDLVGAISPRPGLPLFDGPDAIANYLIAKGYRYVILVHPDSAVLLYRRDIWEKQQHDVLPVWRRSARFYLAAFDAFDKLRETRLHLADAGGMTTLDLASRAP